MPYKDPEVLREYKNKWRREQRLKRGLQKQGRKPLTEEEKVVSAEKKQVYQREWKSNYSKLNPKKRLLYSAAARAKREGLPFSITEEDIVIPTHCPYLGLELCITAARGTKRNNVISLDKIIPSLGYVKGNIEVMSQQANTMKSDASKEELLLFAQEILKRYG